MNASTYTKNELRRVYGFLARLLPPGGRALTSEELLDLNALLDKTRAVVAAHAGAIERGPRILLWRISREQAPTMNEYAFMKTWQRKRLRKELDDYLLPLVANTPGVSLLGAQRMRWARVTRFTNQPKKVDDAAVDAIGGKMPVDALVRCGILAGDTPELLRREARVEKTERGNTHVLVEVFEVAREEVPEGPPPDGAVAPVTRELGELTRHVRDAPAPNGSTK